MSGGLAVGRRAVGDDRLMGRMSDLDIDVRNTRIPAVLCGGPADGVAYVLEGVPRVLAVPRLVAEDFAPCFDLMAERVIKSEFYYDTGATDAEGRRIYRYRNPA